MYDYDGDMEYFQEQVEKKGYTKEEFNMDNYAGLTAMELQGIVNNIRPKKVKKNDKCNA